MSQGELNRVAREQQYIKQKKDDVVEVAKQVRDGNVDIKPEIPATGKVTDALQQGEQLLDRFETSERGQQLGPDGQKIVEDVKRILSDEKNLLETKNEGDILQKIVMHTWELWQQLNGDPAMKGLFNEYQRMISSLMNSGDLKQFSQQSVELFTSIKDTEDFLELMSELIDLMKVMIAERVELITGDNPEALQEYRRHKEIERERIVDELKSNLRALSSNDVWINLTQRSKSVGEQAHNAGDIAKDTTQQVIYRVKESPHFQQLVDDFKTLLQRLAGDNLSVDPLFDNLKAGFNDFVNNQDLSSVINEMQTTLSQVAETPALLDDDRFMKDRIETLLNKADSAFSNVKNNSNLIGAREQSRKILIAIENEPNNAQFLQDIKKLWNDISSDKPGEIIDPNVLNSLRQMVVPMFLEHLNNVPLPAIHDTAEFLGKYEYKLDDMKLSLPELIPDNIHLSFDLEVDANPVRLEASNQRTYLYLKATNIQLHLHDVHWSYERLTFPKHRDSGTADVDTTNNGITIRMKMELKTHGDKSQYMDVLESDVQIQSFSVNFKESKHDKLYEMLTHMFSNQIKKSVVNILQDKLKQFGGYFNDQLLTLIDQAKSTSTDWSKIAAQKTEQARQGIENLKLQAKGTAQSLAQNSTTQQTKDDIKATTKDIIGRASETVHNILDQQKVETQLQERERDIEKILDEPSTNLSGNYGKQPQNSKPSAHDFSPSPVTDPHIMQSQWGSSNPTDDSDALRKTFEGYQPLPTNEPTNDKKGLQSL